MRFKDLSPAAVECLWDRWEYVVQRILYDFNEDVFGGSGSLRENACYDKPYIAVETKKRSLCVFPRQGNILVFIASRGSFKKEYLSLDYAGKGFEHEDILAFDKLDLDKAERRCSTTEDMFCYLTVALKYFHKKHWSALSI